MYDRKGRTPDEGDQANRRKDQRAPEPGVLYDSVTRWKRLAIISPKSPK